MTSTFPSFAIRVCVRVRIARTRSSGSGSRRDFHCDRDHVHEVKSDVSEQKGHRKE